MLTEKLVKDFSPESLLSKEGSTETILLNTVDRLRLQTYLLNGMLLPTEKEEFNKLLDVPESEEKKFEELLQFYQKVNGHCTSFFNGGFTDSVSLASDLVDYAGKVEVYYPGLVDVAEKVLAGQMGEEDGRKRINAIIDDILQSISQYKKKCDTILDSVDVFYKQTLEDLKALNGSDGIPGLMEKYSTEYHLKETNLEDLRNKYNQFYAEVKQKESDYEHNTIVAATTPTYCWVFPFGTIPAIVVAGVYGDRAVKSKKALDEAMANLQETGNKIALFISLHAASVQLEELHDNMQNAMEPVQRLKGFWNAMENDLSNLAKTDEDIKKKAWLVMELGLKEHANKWNDLKVRADEYRISAFICDVMKTSDKAEKEKAEKAA